MPRLPKVGGLMALGLNCAYWLSEQPLPSPSSRIPRWPFDVHIAAIALVAVPETVGPARGVRPHGRDLPVPKQVTDQGVVALHARAVPDEVGLEQMRHFIQLLVELLPCRLVGTQADRPVGPVLEPLLDSRVALEADPMRVVGAEREPARELFVHVELQRVI